MLTYLTIIGLKFIQTLYALTYIMSCIKTLIHKYQRV